MVVLPPSKIMKHGGLTIKKGKYKGDTGGFNINKKDFTVVTDEERKWWI